MKDARIEKLEKALSEANRFINLAHKAKDRLEAEANEHYRAYATKEFAAAKRSSLDLTRALAELRKSNL